MHPFGTASAAARRKKKWVYLLDHQYTQKGLSWKQLKNHDALRAKVLARVAKELNLDIYLALAEIQETWEAYAEDDDGSYGYSRRSHWDDWEDDGEETEDEQEEPAADTDYELESLIDGSVELRHWVDERGKPVRRPAELVSGEELCLTTETADFDPFKSEYEGNMGNYGNTLDRWYHRAAIVLVPRKRKTPGSKAAARPRPKPGKRR